MGRANKRRDTKIELQIGSMLHRQGLRYRRDLPIVAEGVRVRPDFVFTRQRLAVFIDGCFWHWCPQHCTVPRANRERDGKVTSALTSAGWRVLRVWEHEALERAVERIRAAAQPDAAR